MKTYLQNGFSMIELLLALALFVIIATGSITLIVSGFNTNRLSAELTIANQYATEGLEAAKSIKNQAYTNVTAINPTPRGVLRNGSSVWAFDADLTNDTLTHNSTDNYIRTVKVESVNRDVSGNIVIAPAGTTDPDSKKVTSTVTWNFNSARAESVSLISYLTDWRKPISPAKGGILVYGNGGTTSDAIVYRILNTDGTWGAANSLPDFDTSSSNKALRAIRVYASATRNEKILLTRHYSTSPSQESIWVHIYNGSTWASSQMVSWTASSYDTSNQGIKNFDGQYLNNGNFLFVYSDNTTTPKYRIWNGSSWSPNPPSAGSSITNVGGIPSNITLRNRSGSNETMLVVFDQTRDTNTTYFNGSAWSSALEHAANAPTDNKEFVEFAWSAHNPLKGALIFQTASNDRAMNIKIWIADGSGSGSWIGNNINTSNQGTLGAMELDGGRRGAEEFLACDKDASNDIYCFRGASVPAWTSPASNIMTTTTDTGIQRSFDLAYDGATGTEGIVVYSDITTVPKLKKYTASSNSFDSSATNLPSLGGALRTVKLRNLSDNDDIMIMLGNANNDFYTVVWDGSTNTLYTTPSGKAFTTQGTNGSNSIELWYGFAWDKF